MFGGVQAHIEATIGMPNKDVGRGESRGGEQMLEIVRPVLERSRQGCWVACAEICPIIRADTCDFHRRKLHLAPSCRRPTVPSVQDHGWIARTQADHRQAAVANPHLPVDWRWACRWRCWCSRAARRCTADQE